MVDPVQVLPGAIGLVWLHNQCSFTSSVPFRYFEYAFDTRVDVILAGCALALATRLPEARHSLNVLTSRPWSILGSIALLVPTVIVVGRGARTACPVTSPMGPAASAAVDYPAVHSARGMERPARVQWPQLAGGALLRRPVAADLSTIVPSASW